MSQHALKLAEAASALLDGHKLYVAGAGPLNECVSTENFAALREALVAYLASDEHAEDLERARAGAAGFQGLAKGAAPSDTAHPEGEREAAIKRLTQHAAWLEMLARAATTSEKERPKRKQMAADLRVLLSGSRPQGEEGLSEDDRGRLMTLVGSVASVDRTEEYRAFKERVFAALCNQGKPSS